MVLNIFNSEDTMEKPNFFNEMQDKINQVLENSPAKDIEKNVKAMMSQGFSKPVSYTHLTLPTSDLV